MYWNWHRMPFVRFLIPFIAGIVLAIVIDSPLAWLPYALLALGGGCLSIPFWRTLFLRRYLFGAVFIIFLLGTGYQLTIQHHPDRQPNSPTAWRGREVLLYGMVTTPPTLRKTAKCQLALRGIGAHPDSLMAVKGKVMVYLDTALGVPQAGDWLAVRGRLEEWDAPLNPRQFDYRFYLQTNGITHRLYSSDWQVQPAPPLSLSSRFEQWVAHTRRQALQALARHLSEPRALAVGGALILGDRAELTDDILAAYAETGAMHVLSVSGLHVGIVAFLLQYILLVIPLRGKMAPLVKLMANFIGIWLFALITGMSPSVMRSALMFSLVIIGQYIGRQALIYNTLAASAFVSLLINPYLILNIGFQLSYLAVLGIVYFHPLFYRQWQPKSKLLDYCWSLTCVSLAAQLATLPLGIYYFHQFPALFWLSGLVVVPASTVILAVGIAVIALGNVPLLGVTLGKLLLWSVQGVNMSIFFLQALPFGNFQNLYINEAILWLMSGAVVGLALVLGATDEARRTKYLLVWLAILTAWAGVWAATKVEIQQQQFAMVYHAPRHTVVDIFWGKNAVSFSTDGESEYNTKGFRLAHGIGQPVVLPPDTTASGAYFYMQRGIGIVGKHKFAIIRPQTPIPNSPIPVDFIVLSGNPRQQLTDILSAFPSTILVADASNSDYRISEWIKTTESLGRSLVNVKTNGAYRIPLTN